MSDDILISVVITTHNRLSKLKRAYHSVLGQSINCYELIIVDDASTDGTSEWAYSIDDSRVQYRRVNHSESSGANHARNIGITMSRGRYLAFLDDDDYWFPNKLELQLEYAKKGYDIVSSYWCVEYGKGKWYKVASDEDDWSFPNLLKECRGGATSVPLLNKESVLDVGGFDESVVKGQDHDLWIRMIRHGCTVKTVRSVLVKYYSSEDSVYGDSLKLIQSTEYKLRKYADLYDLFPEARSYVLNKIAYDLIRHHHDYRTGLSYKKAAVKFDTKSKYNLFLLSKLKQKGKDKRRIIRMAEEPWHGCADLSD